MCCLATLITGQMLRACLAFGLAPFSAGWPPGTDCLLRTCWMCWVPMHSALTASACAWPGCFAWPPSLAQPGQTSLCTTHNLTCGKRSAPPIAKAHWYMPIWLQDWWRHGAAGGSRLVVAGHYRRASAGPHEPPCAMCLSRLCESAPQLPDAGCYRQSSCRLLSLSSVVALCLAVSTPCLPVAQHLS